MPSPLLGLATWRPVEAWLRRTGHHVRTVDHGARTRTPEAVLDAAVAAAGGTRVTLVPHSNAGLYAPRLASLVDVAATVFVDAALPDPDAERRGETHLAPPAFRDFLRDLADEEGVLPRWTDWWDDVSDLFPDRSTRRAVEREQQRLPLTYFTSTVPVPAGWSDRPSAFLAFGETYAVERDRAASLGWRTTTLPGGHLHALRDPAAVGAAIVDLARH